MSNMSKIAKIREKQIKQLAAQGPKGVSLRKWRNNMCRICKCYPCDDSFKCRRARGQESYDARMEAKRDAEKEQRRQDRKKNRANKRAFARRQTAAMNVAEAKAKSAHRTSDPKTRKKAIARARSAAKRNTK